MRIGNRLFPYPVLRPGQSDYETSAFQTERVVSNTLETMRMSVRIRMECDDLQALVASGDARYALHLECAQSSYRELLVQNASPVFNHAVQISKLQGALESVALVLAARDIRRYASDDFGPELKGLSFDIPKGSVLACENLPIIDVDNPLESVWGGKPIFIAYKLPGSGDEPMLVEMNKDSVMIGLGAREYDRYARLARDPRLQPLLNAALVFPALVYVLERLGEETPEEWLKYEWFVALSDLYARRGKSFEALLMDADDGVPSIRLAQELMEQPVASAFGSLLEFEFETGPEEEEE